MGLTHPDAGAYAIVSPAAAAAEGGKADKGKPRKHTSLANWAKVKAWDAIAGRIRRLLAMADKRAQDLDIDGRSAMTKKELISALRA